MSDHPLDSEHHRMGAQMQNVFSGWNLQLDMYEGMVHQATERGWTDEQARRIIASVLGGRPDIEADEDDE